ncbi:MAG: hypothetical protein AAGJ50_09760 [Pseudomonadota bacterium]
MIGKIIQSGDMLASSRDHLGVKLISPDWMILPITETGYRSIYLPIGTIGDTCGPLDYVAAWLDDAAQDPKYLQQLQHCRQDDLFGTSNGEE